MYILSDIGDVMLYVSKADMPKQLVYVTDTDDGVETCISIEELFNIHNLGVQIVGALFSVNDESPIQISPCSLLSNAEISKRLTLNSHKVQVGASADSYVIVHFDGSVLIVCIPDCVEKFDIYPVYGNPYQSTLFTWLDANLYSEDEKRHILASHEKQLKKYHGMIRAMEEARYLRPDLRAVSSIVVGGRGLTDLSYVFSQWKTPFLDLSRLHTDNVVDFSNAFNYACSHVKLIYFGNMSVSSMKYSNGMFAQNSEYPILQLSGTNKRLYNLLLRKRLENNIRF